MADQLSDSDTQLLADATAAVFVLVAGSDGGIDKKERNRFDAMIARSDQSGDGKLAAIMTLAASRAAKVVSELQGAEAEALLERVAAVAGQSLSADDCQRYKQGLLHMAQAIAKASGGGLLGISDPVADSESAAIRRLRELIDYDGE